MVVSKDMNNKTEVYKNLYKCFRTRHKKAYDCCLTHAVITVVGAFSLTVLLKVCGCPIDLPVALIAQTLYGVMLFFSDRWALRQRFNSRSWEVLAGYVSEELCDDIESREILRKAGVHFYVIKNLQGDYVGFTLGADTVNADFEDGALIWYNEELNAIFRRDLKTSEDGEVL